MRTLRKTIVISASILGLTLASPALAAPITGSDTVGASVTGSNVSGNIGASTSFGVSGGLENFSVGGAGSGSFSFIPPGTSVPFNNATLNLGTASTFGFVSPGVGT